MRARYGTDDAIRIAEGIKAEIERAGVWLTITPPAALVASGSPVLAVKALLEAPKSIKYDTAKGEGVLNIDATSPYAITVAYDSGVVEMSSFPWRARPTDVLHTYKIFNLMGQPYGDTGAVLGYRGLAQRVT